MMIILGLDGAQATGFAYYDTDAPLSSIRAGTIRAKGDDYEHKAAALGMGLVRLIKADKPDFVVIEEPLRTQPGAHAKRKVQFMGEETEQEAPSGSGIAAVISSNQMVGALAAIVGAYGIPFETVSSSTWRKASYGFGKRPGWQRKDWKKHARTMCAQHRISVTNDDAAEACWIAFAGAGCQTFKMLRTGRAA